MTSPARPRAVYTALLLASGLGSSALAGSAWPALVAAAAAVFGWFAAAPRRLGSGSQSQEGESSAALLARVGGELRRRHLEVERVADEIRELLQRPGRDAELWRPEVARVADLVGAHLRLAAQLEDDAPAADDVTNLEARLKELKLRSPRPEVAQEIETVEQRLELARSRDDRVRAKDGQLRQIESALALVRDRLAARGDDFEASGALEALVAGAEAAAAAEREVGGLARVSAARRSEGAGKP